MIFARVTKTLRTSGIRDQIEITLAIAGFHVFEAMPFLGHGEQRFREELQPLDMQAEFARPGAEQIAFGADDVAHVEQLEKLIVAFRHGVFFDVDLQSLAVLRMCMKAGLAHAADGLDASGDAHADFGHKFFRGFRGVFGQNFGDGMGEIERCRRAEAERFDLAHARGALKNSVFELTIGNLLGESVIISNGQ